ncbi:MAG: hypothetical protein SCJ97_03265 [Bacillota bacterium]|nr:hypothetical protein [Bacillota bacterium]
MEPDFLILLYGFSAYLSATATIITLITGILFAKKGGLFGPLNDLSSIIQVIFMIPLAFYFFSILLPVSRVISTIALLIGLCGMLFSAYGQSLLVLKRITFNQSRKYIPAGTAIGIWLIIVCLIASREFLIPNTLGWIGITAGFGFILTVIGFLKGGFKSSLFYLGSFVTGISYPIWAIWLGCILLS